MIDKELTNRIIGLRELKLSLREISTVTGIPKSTIHDLLVREGVCKKEVDPKNILVVGDTHLPFQKKGYLEFCLGVYEKYDCDHVIFIGDVVDNHFSSYHEIDPDGYSAGDELFLVKKEIAKWYEAFPIADWVIGNHDKLVARKNKTSGVSKQWLRDITDVLEVPNWNYNSQFYYDGVLYRHGVNAGSATNVLSDNCSLVQGHFHSTCRITYKVGKGGKCFGMQCPVGVDDDSYAMAYNESRKSIIGCSVVLDHGKLPIIELMEL